MFIDPTIEIVTFAQLSQAFKKRLRMQDRDRALVMTGVCASMLQMPIIARFCRKLILSNNHAHMLRRFDSFEEALKTEDFTTFLKQVRRKLSAEKATALLEELDYQCHVDASDSRGGDDAAYIAVLLGVDLEWLTENFG